MPVSRNYGQPISPVNRVLGGMSQMCIMNHGTDEAGLSEGQHMHQRPVGLMLNNLPHLVFQLLFICQDWNCSLHMYATPEAGWWSSGCCSQRMLTVFTKNKLVVHVLVAPKHWSQDKWRGSKNSSLQTQTRFGFSCFEMCTAALKRGVCERATVPVRRSSH